MYSYALKEMAQEIYMRKWPFVQLIQNGHFPYRKKHQLKLV